MLEQMRKQGASLFIWLIFGILIAVFVVNFGPQSPGSGQGCSGAGDRTYLTVGDSEVDDVGFRFAINLIPGESDHERAAIAMEALIMRELLAQEAERRGLRVPDGHVDRVIASGKLHFQGALLSEGTAVLDFRRAFFNEDQIFDYDQFKRWVRNRGLSVGAYKKQQAREIMASTMATILMGSVPASREEALASYITRNTTVAFAAVRFDPRRYGDNLLVTDADLDRWIAAHEAQVAATYSAESWKGKKQVRVRRLSIVKAAEPPAPPAVDPGKARLDGLRAAIVAGRTSFEAAARASERDPRLAARGGDLGWHDADAPSLYEPAFDVAIATLEPGKVSEVIETEDAFTILTVVDRREGDLTFDQVKRELAEPMARDAWGKEAAKRAALAALATAQAGGGKSLTELFPGDTGAKTGAVVRDFVDVPVKWAQGDPPPPAAGDAPPAAGATPPAAPPPTPLVATDEVLPALGALAAPAAETFGPVARAANRTPLGESAELARALFDELTTGALAPRVFEVRASVVSPAVYVIVQVTAKSLADVTAFEKEAESHVATLARERGARYMVDWLRERCTSLAASKRIQPLWSVLQGFDEQGNKLPIAYAPCMSFNVLD